MKRILINTVLGAVMAIAVPALAAPKADGRP